MQSTNRIVIGFLAGSLGFNAIGTAQKVTHAAPTAADWAALAKLPDLTGVWEVGLGGGGGAAAGGGRGAAPAAPAAAGRGAAPTPAPPAAGRGRGGAQGRGGPSLTPAYAAKAASPALNGDQSANCLPPGLPGIMSQPYPLEILMTPGKVTIISEAYTQVRHIYTDGRPLPADPDPTFFGTSIGRWEDGVLVIESVGFAEVPRGLSFPFSDKLRIVERLRLTDPDTLTIETTLIDPEALTMPYSMGSRTLRRHRNWTLAEYICEENNRNFVDQEGKAGVRLANPLASPK